MSVIREDLGSDTEQEDEDENESLQGEQEIFETDPSSNQHEITENSLEEQSAEA